jgi:hypothetical protein
MCGYRTRASHDCGSSIGEPRRSASTQREMLPAGDYAAVVHYPDGRSTRNASLTSRRVGVFLKSLPTDVP